MEVKVGDSNQDIDGYKSKEENDRFEEFDRFFRCSGSAWTNQTPKMDYDDFCCSRFQLWYINIVICTTYINRKYVFYTYRYNLTTDLEIHEDLFSPLIGGELKITLYFKNEPTETQLKVSLI